MGALTYVNARHTREGGGLVPSRPYRMGDPRSEAGALTPGMGRGGEAQDLRQNEGECPTMARLVGVDLPRDKRVEIALTYIYGIGRTRAHEILAATGVSADMRVHQL